MGKFNIQLKKEWRAMPKGISVVIGCSTFPTWNSVTGIYGSLITGNAVIVKPHPGAILPIALVVAEIQKVLSENNLDPNTCQLAVDTFDKMITKELAEHADVKLFGVCRMCEVWTEAHRRCSCYSLWGLCRFR